MIINVELLKSVNSVEFGSEREKVREFFGEFNEFAKTDFNENTSDDFGFAHVFYDKHNCFEAIEIFGEAEVKINGQTVFPQNIQTAQKIIENLNADGNEYYTSVNKSVGIYAPDGQIESILFAGKNYYN